MNVAADREKNQKYFSNEVTAQLRILRERVIEALARLSGRNSGSIDKL